MRILLHFSFGLADFGTKINAAWDAYHNYDCYKLHPNNKGKVTKKECEKRLRE